MSTTKNNKLLKQGSFDLSIPGHLTKTSLVLPKNLEIEQWQEVGRILSVGNMAMHWWIGDWLNYGEAKYGEMYSQAMDETDFEYGTLANDKFVASKIEFSRRRENLSFAHHYEVADLDPAEQTKWLDQAETNGWTRHELRVRLREEKRNVRQITNPTGKFDLVLADPPWQYEHCETQNREIENQYPTMTLEEICRDGPDTADDSILLLWATAPKLEEAMEVMKAWGFSYRTSAVWDKQVIGMGYWWRVQHEILLLGVKGSPGATPETKRRSSVFSDKRQKHSVKPDSVYNWIEEAFPNLSKLEMYCRKPRPGWASHGNEI